MATIESGTAAHRLADAHVDAVPHGAFRSVAAAALVLIASLAVPAVASTDLTHPRHAGTATGTHDRAMCWHRAHRTGTDPDLCGR